MAQEGPQGSLRGTGAEMAEQQLRESGIGAVGGVPWGTHFCEFYHTRDGLLDTLVPYFRAGLQNNEFCLWITSEPLTAEAARAALARAVPDLDARTERGQIEIRDLHEWYVPGGGFDADAVLGRWLEKEQLARERGFDGLRLTGNTFWLRRDAWDDFMECEARVHAAFARHRVLALCTYSLEQCTADDVLDVVRTHQFALARRRGGWEMIESSVVRTAQAELQRLNEQLERHVSERTSELEAALRARDELLAMLAHELRNPLAPIRNGLHILQRAGDRGAREQALEMIVRQVLHLSQVVDDLVEVSRLTRGVVRVRDDRFDLGRLVRSAAEGHRRTLEERGLAFAVGVPETPVWVRGEETRLAQVLNNLIDNAAQFTEQGGVAVRLRADVFSQDAGAAVLMVFDTGIGIAADVLPRLFQAFAQADQGLARPRGGLGLGLAVVKGLVELHGGTVAAASDGPGRGATFTVRLPLEPEPAALSEMHGGEVSPAGRALRVLVVEDNADAAHSLRLLLGLMGHVVRVAHTGPDGVEESAGWQPDVVVSDIGLPGADGYEVARQVRGQPGMSEALLIALTGYGSEADRRQSRDAGFDHHLTKPTDPDALEQLLSDWQLSRPAS